MAHAFTHQDLLPAPGSQESEPPIELHATATNSRVHTLKHLQSLLRLCRGYLLKDSDTTDKPSFDLEVPRHNIFDLYSGLLAADLSLDRDSHLRLTSLCTLRRYHPLRGGNVTLRLELAFPDEAPPEDSLDRLLLDADLA